MMDVVGFAHQVGGHFGLLKCIGHVLKPLNEREYAFYSRMDPRFAPFTAVCCARVRVSVEPVQSISLPSNLQTSKASHDEPSSFYPSELAIQTDAVLSCHPASRLRLPFPSDSKITFHLDGGRRVTLCEKTTKNQWAKQCQSRIVQKILSKRKSREFIALEDAVERFRLPCVIDLKMGQRQHGDDASEEKKLSQSEKCKRSTSHELGIRMVGMQLYDMNAGQYNYVNKYEGRKMSKTELHEALSNFLSQAGRRRLAVLIKTLTSIRETVLAADSFRFFSSSILIAYDYVEKALTNGTDDIEVKMIDFAHSTHNGFSVNNDAKEDQLYSGHDEGYLLGLDSLLRIVSQIIESQPNAVDEDDCDRIPEKRKRLDAKEKV